MRAGQALDVDASVGIGTLRVIVPDGVDVVVDAHVRAGEIRLPDGEAYGGWTVAERWADGPSTSRAGSLELDVDTVFGQVVVERG